MNVRLVPIMGVPAEWETEHQIRALAVNGRSPAAGDLESLERVHPKDYKKLLKVIKVIKVVAETDRVHNMSHVKKGRHHKQIYEMRGGQARLFFFYTPDEKSIVVCTNSYWKAKPSETEQDQAFAQADRFRRLYFELKRRER